MNGYRKIKLLLRTVVILVPTLLFIPEASAGSFGAEIFCTMRDGGNDHESSWEAAYTYIKKQKGGIFKVSPNQAASQIIETIVRERDKFSFCIQYLAPLYPDRKLQREIEQNKKAIEKKEQEQQHRRKKIDALIDQQDTFSEESIDRYSY